MGRKPKYLYHGSPRKLIGKYLLPMKPKEIDPFQPEHNLKAVYATPYKEEAIAMAFHTMNGDRSSMKVRKIKGKWKIIHSIVMEGWPKKEHIYLHTLSPKNFKNKPKGRSQWISFEKEKPIKTERLQSKNYYHLIRKPTKKNTNNTKRIKRKNNKN